MVVTNGKVSKTSFLRKKKNIGSAPNFFAMSPRATSALAVTLCCLLGILGYYYQDVRADQQTSGLFVPTDAEKETHPSKSASNETATATAGNNGTHNGSVSSTTHPPPVLPAADAQEVEHKSSIAIFFILFVIVLCILLVHFIIVNHLHFIPESLAIVFLGAVIGAIVSYSNYSQKLLEAEAFSANAFFLILLPPIIFESGYNLHKGNFYANIGSILTFAILGTAISAIIVGGGIYILVPVPVWDCPLGEADLIYSLPGVHAFAFGALISAVDPVATLAIFQALDVDPVLYMLVFGESMLNDAVAIVLTTTVLELNSPSMEGLSWTGAAWTGLARFAAVFVASSLLGAAAAVLSALLLKHVDLRNTPSLEFAILLVFAYLPYGLAEGLHLSGIMAILFCGIVMSHYTHFNLSPMTQVTMQQTFRTLAFVAETCVFAYLGLAIFTFPLIIKPVLIIWSIILCLVGRAANIFPLAYLCNRFREHKIPKKHQFIMWFSGLRGAIAFALSLYMDWSHRETRRVMIGNTLVTVLFTTVVLGGGTLPLIKLLNNYFDAEEPPDDNAQQVLAQSPDKRRKPKRKLPISVSKTQEMTLVFDADYSYSDFTEYETAGQSDGGRNRGSPERRNRSSARAREPGVNGAARSGLAWASSGLWYLDAHYVRPLLVRKFTKRERRAATLELTDRALAWYNAAAQCSSSEEEDNAAGTQLPMQSVQSTSANNGGDASMGQSDISIRLDQMDSASRGAKKAAAAEPSVSWHRSQIDSSDSDDDRPLFK